MCKKRENSGEIVSDLFPESKTSCTETLLRGDFYQTNWLIGQNGCALDMDNLDGPLTAVSKCTNSCRYVPYIYVHVR